MSFFALYNEDRLQEAIGFIVAAELTNISEVADNYDVNRRTLANRLKGQQPRSARTAPHSLLTEAEEAAICHYIERLDRINLTWPYKVCRAGLQGSTSTKELSTTIWRRFNSIRRPGDGEKEGRK